LVPRDGAGIFESEDTAKFLNEHFVSIKVDREERPDVDKIYMTFVQSTTGQGGWPLNVFLTPDLKPFFGGTYFPPDDRHGRSSFVQVLKQIQKLWKPATATSPIPRTRCTRVCRRPRRAERCRIFSSLPRPFASRSAVQGIVRPRHGGFAARPNFLSPASRSSARYAKRFKDEEAIRMVLHTCDRMAAGGIHDQLGGGFARYAVDAEWLVPHFEKDAL